MTGASSGEIQPKEDALKAAPAVRVAPKADIPLVSMVKPLTYEEADAIIRKNAASFSFSTGKQSLGRVDVVSLATKHQTEDFWDVRVTEGPDGQDTLYAGVFDGHNGSENSELISRTLVPYVAASLSSLPRGEDESTAVEHAIQQAFVDLDDQILDIAKKALAAGHPTGAAELRAALGTAYAGSCAVLLIYEAASATVRVAVTGDSRAVRGQWSPEQDKPIVDVLTKDQNVRNELEYARIAAAHPGEENDIMDMEYGDFLRISVTRAFGDYQWKWPKELVMQARSTCHGPKPLAKSKTPPYLTARPEVTTRTAVAAQDFVILGSDGLWEAISSEDAVECVSRWVAARRAGKPEAVVESRESRYDIDEQNGGLSRTARPADFAIDDLDNAAVCLLKNVLGGRHRYMVAGSLTATPPLSRYVRDDMTVQVVFFQAP